MARLMAGAWDRPVVTTTRRGEAGFRVVGVLLLGLPFLPVAAPRAAGVLHHAAPHRRRARVVRAVPPRPLRPLGARPVGRGAVDRADPLLTRHDRRDGRLRPPGIRRDRGGGHGGALPPLALLPPHGRELHEPSADALLRVARPARLRPLV